jgi:HemY protein
MRFIIWLFILSITAVLAAWLMKNNAGHVAIFWNTYRYDMSLNTGLTLLVLFNIVCFFVLRLVSGLINLPLKAKAYRIRQRSFRAYTELAQAVEHFSQGDISKQLKAHNFLLLALKPPVLHG